MHVALGDQCSPPDSVSELVLRDGRAYHLSVAGHELARNWVVVGDPARAMRVAAHFDSIEHDRRHREYVTLTGTYRGVPMTVIGTGIGTDNLEIALLEGYGVLDIDPLTGRKDPDSLPVRVIRVGTSGGARDDVAPGTLVVSQYAIGLDSTGLYFDVPAADATVLALEEAASAAMAATTKLGARFASRLPVYAARADIALAQQLAEICRARGLPMACGTTVAASGFFGASGRKMDGTSLTVPGIKHALATIEVMGQRVLNFDMESSLLFHLAQSIGWRAATICPTISAPSAHGAVIDPQAAVDAAILVALDVLALGRATAPT